jgi:hypothetical protein
MVRLYVSTPTWILGGGAAVSSTRDGPDHQWRKRMPLPRSWRDGFLPRLTPRQTKRELGATVPDDDSSARPTVVMCLSEWARRFSFCPRGHRILATPFSTFPFPSIGDVPIRAGVALRRQRGGTHDRSRGVSQEDPPQESHSKTYGESDPPNATTRRRRSPSARVLRGRPSRAQRPTAKAPRRPRPVPRDRRRRRRVR